MSAIVKQKAKTCQGCPFIERPAVWGHGSKSAQVMVVGEYPKEDVLQYGIPFAGNLSTFYRSMLHRSNLNLDDTYTTYAVKCNPPENVSSSSKTMTEAMMCCRHLIDKEIEHLNPEVIIATGELPFRSLTAQKKIGDHRGVFRDHNGVKLMPTLSLGSVFYSPKNEGIIEQDFKIVGELLEYDIKKKPKPKEITWTVCKTVAEVEHWVEKLKKHDYLSVDCETTCLDRSTMKPKMKKGGLIYTVYDVMLIQVGYSDTAAVLFPLERQLREPMYSPKDLKRVKEALRSLFETPGITWAIQDIMMDIRCLYKTLKIKYKNMKFVDTLMMQHVLNENDPADLDSLAARYTDMGSYKNALNAKYRDLPSITPKVKRGKKKETKQLTLGIKRKFHAVKQK